MSSDDKYLAIGTDQSCVRFVDLANMNDIKTVKVHKLFKKAKTVNCVRFVPDHDQQDQLVVSSQQSRKLFFLKVDDFKI